MKLKLLAALIVGLGLASLTGCQTLTDTPGDNYVRVAHAVDLDMRQVSEDTENLLLIDHPIWLSRKPIPNE